MPGTGVTRRPRRPTSPTTERRRPSVRRTPVAPQADRHGRPRRRTRRLPRRGSTESGAGSGRAAVLDRGRPHGRRRDRTGAGWGWAPTGGAADSRPAPDPAAGARVPGRAARVIERRHPRRSSAMAGAGAGPGDDRGQDDETSRSRDGADGRAPAPGRPSSAGDTPAAPADRRAQPTGHPTSWKHRRSRPRMRRSTRLVGRRPAPAEPEHPRGLLGLPPGLPDRRPSSPCSSSS